MRLFLFIAFFSYLNPQAFSAPLCSCNGLGGNFPGFTLYCDGHVIKRFPFGENEEEAREACELEKRQQLESVVIGKNLSCNFADDIGINDQTGQHGSFNSPTAFSVHKLDLYDESEKRIKIVLHDDSQANHDFVWYASQDTCGRIARLIPLSHQVCYTLSDPHLPIGETSQEQLVLPSDWIASPGLKELHVIAPIGVPNLGQIDVTDRFSCEEH